MSESVTISTLSGDESFSAYFAKPSGKPKAAIIVIQEIFGVNAGIRRKCDKWAEEGYLAVRTGDEGRSYRIGEPASWGGPNSFSEDDEDVRALRAACGDDPIINVAAPESERLFATPEALWVLDYAYSKNITYEKAWDRVIRCIEGHLDRGRRPLDARDRCIDQYNGWDYIGDEMPPPPGG